MSSYSAPRTRTLGSNDYYLVDGIQIGTGGEIYFEAEPTLNINRDAAGSIQARSSDATQARFFIDNQSATGNAVLAMITAAGSSGDNYLYFFEGNSTSTQWALGRDDSDSGAFKLSQNATLGTNDFFTVSTAGLVSIPTGPLRLADGTVNAPAISFISQSGLGFYKVATDHVRLVGGDTTTLSVYNAGTNDSSILSLTNAGSSTGDQYVHFLEGGVTASQWAAGRDDSDSGAFKISQSSAPGTNDFFVVTTAGLVTLGASLSTATMTLNARNILHAYNADNEGYFNSYNASTGASANMKIVAETASLTADAYFRANNGTANFAFGVDGSDSSKFKISGSATLGTSDYFSITTGGLLTLGASGGTSVHLLHGMFTASMSSATDISYIFSNTENATATSGTALKVRVGGSSGGDPFTQYRITGVLDWYTGIDNSDSDKFCIGQSSTVGTNSYITIDTSGSVTLGVTGGSAVHRLNTASGTTVGAAGGASALPATPAGYVLMNINGTNQAIPYYAAS